MKYIEERDGFLNEAVRSNNNKKKMIKKVFIVIEELYKIFKGDTGVYISARDLALRKIFTKNGISSNLMGIREFLIVSGERQQRIYSLKSNKKPTIKDAERVDALSRKLANDAIIRRKENNKPDPAIKKLPMKERIRWALEKIKKDIATNMGRIYPSSIWMQAAITDSKLNTLSVKNKIYYNYVLKNDAATLKQVEKFFSKAWKAKLGMPSFSDVKHGLYVWNAGDVTDEMVDNLHDSFYEAHRKKTNSFNKSLVGKEREEKTRISTQWNTNSFAKETPEEREIRLKKRSAEQKVRRDKETPEEREIRLEKGREYDRNARANETPEQREARLKRKRENKRKNKK